MRQDSTGNLPLVIVRSDLTHTLFAKIVCSFLTYLFLSKILPQLLIGVAAPIYSLRENANNMFQFHAVSICNIDNARVVAEDGIEPSPSSLWDLRATTALLRVVMCCKSSNNSLTRKINSKKIHPTKFFNPAGWTPQKTFHLIVHCKNTPFRGEQNLTPTLFRGEFCFRYGLNVNVS